MLIRLRGDSAMTAVRQGSGESDMTTVEKMFADFCAAYERGEQPNLGDYLAATSGADRRGLEARIDLYLIEQAPSRPFDADAFARELERPVMKRVADIFAERAAVDLGAARARAGLSLDELAGALLAAAEVEDGAKQREKAAEYLGRLEAGSLAILTGRVRDALRTILDVDPAASFERPDYGFAFRMRASSIEPSADNIELAEMLIDAATTPSPLGWDEVDELFLAND